MARTGEQRSSSSSGDKSFFIVFPMIHYTDDNGTAISETMAMSRDIVVSRSAAPNFKTTTSSGPWHPRKISSVQTVMKVARFFDPRTIRERICPRRRGNERTASVKHLHAKDLINACAESASHINGNEISSFLERGERERERERETASL